MTLRRFANHAEIGPRAQLHGTLRAIAIEGDAAQVLSGVLKPGDHVDLVSSFDPGDNGSGTISRVVVRNLLVLQASEAAGSKASPNWTGGRTLRCAASWVGCRDRRRSRP